MAKLDADVIVVGGGNAAFSAALAAEEQGASVLMLEAAPEDESGGNSRFTAGSVRVVYNGVDDIKALVPDLTEQEVATTDFGTYTQEQFFDDMARVTQNRADPDLVELLVTRSFDTFCWMRDKGVRFIPIYGRQAFKIDGKFKFWGGLTVEAVGGGPGLIKMLTEAATKRGIGIRYETRALSLVYDGVRVEGVRIRHQGAESDLHSKSVVLACGGFESNSEWRTRYLGPGWDLAKVRGTRFNTGDGIRMALDIGASPCGNWSGCHAVQWEMNAPEFGDLANDRPAVALQPGPIAAGEVVLPLRDRDIGVDMYFPKYAICEVRRVIHTRFRISLPRIQGAAYSILACALASRLHRAMPEHDEWLGTFRVQQQQRWKYPRVAIPERVTRVVGR